MEKLPVPGEDPGQTRITNGIQIQKTGDRSAGWSVRLLTVIRYKKLTDRHFALWYTKTILKIRQSIRPCVFCRIIRNKITIQHVYGERQKQMRIFEE